MSTPRSFPQHPRRRALGVSLIEALVALAVLAFGLLGVAGMQSSLRATADSTRQRAEAVRMAQEKIEELRAFALLSGAGSGQVDYDDIVSGNDTPAPPSGYANTSFARTWTVTTPGSGAPPFKVLNVSVTWTDRNNVSGSVTLTSNVLRAAPAVAAAKMLRGDLSAVQLPRGRNVDIPPGAIDNGDGTSRFTPPGGSGQTWTIDNITGLVTETSTDPDACRTTGDSPVARCMILWGIVRFVNAGSQPTGADAEIPDGSRVSGTGVSLAMTTPTTPATITCFTETGSLRVGYYCLVQGTNTSPPQWTGSEPTVRITGLTLAANAADATASSFRVCRYTPVLTHTPTGGNADNPLKFTDVRTSLGNKNYLVIRAGDDSTAYTCPTDDTSTPFINGNTCPHQPIADPRQNTPCG
jgi:Tfp pilus assembly protein PilV